VQWSRATLKIDDPGNNREYTLMRHFLLPPAIAITPAPFDAAFRQISACIRRQPVLEITPQAPGRVS